MRQRPKGTRYRNLIARSGVIYYQRRFRGERIRFSCETDDWDQAASVRDLFEARQRIGLPVPIVESPTFAETARNYLATAGRHLAPSSYHDRVSLLGPSGRITRAFGSTRLNAVNRAVLAEWWEVEVEQRNRALNTGLNYLNALSAVFGYALDRDWIAENPVDQFRATLRRRRRTKRGRAEAERRQTRHPIERLADLAALLRASERAGCGVATNGRPAMQGRNGHVANLLMLDAGLRLGEVAALRWQHVEFGKSPDDPRRFLNIRESRARGRYEGAPKSGRTRQVDLSRRLRRVLRDHWIALGQPSPNDRLLPKFHPQNFGRRFFSSVCVDARIGRYTPKDLRDTFASHLLTLGVQLGYVSQQLGHADVSVTARHYAKWVDADGYRRPLGLVSGELPVDLMERVSTQFFSGNRRTDYLGSALK